MKLMVLHKILHILVGSNPFFDKIQKKIKNLKKYMLKSIIFMLFDNKKLQKNKKLKFIFSFFKYLWYFALIPTLG